MMHSGVDSGSCMFLFKDSRNVFNCGSKFWRITTFWNNVPGKHDKVIVV